MVALGLLTVGCGESDTADNESAAQSTATSTGSTLASVDQWCATARESLPAIASPNPDGQELEVLDLHIARSETLAAGAAGVPAEATTVAAQMADSLSSVRQRVVDGEALADVLQEIFAADNHLLTTAADLDAQVVEVCAE